MIEGDWTSSKPIDMSAEEQVRSWAIRRTTNDEGVLALGLYYHDAKTGKGEFMYFLPDDEVSLRGLRDTITFFLGE